MKLHFTIGILHYHTELSMCFNIYQLIVSMYIDAVARFGTKSYDAAEERPERLSV